MAKSKSKSKDNELIPKIILVFVFIFFILALYPSNNSDTNYISNTNSDTNSNTRVVYTSEDYDIFTDSSCSGAEYSDDDGWSINFRADIYNKENFDIELRNVEFSFYNERGKLVGKDNATIQDWKKELDSNEETYVSSRAFNLKGEPARDGFFSDTDYPCKAIVYFYKN